MARIYSQINQLRKLIAPVYKIQYVEHEVLEKDWEPHIIYIHFLL